MNRIRTANVLARAVQLLAAIMRGLSMGQAPTPTTTVRDTQCVSVTCGTTTAANGLSLHALKHTCRNGIIRNAT